MSITFVSVWDGGYQVESAAMYDPDTGIVYDVETADLPEHILNDLEVLDGEYAEIDGSRYELQDLRDGTWLVLQ